MGNLYLPNLNAEIINNGVVKGDTSYIWRTGSVMLGIALSLGAVSVMAVYWASRVSMGVGADVRAAVFQRVQSFSAREISRFGTPSLVTRNTNDVQQVQTFLQTPCCGHRQRRRACYLHHRFRGPMAAGLGSTEGVHYKRWRSQSMTVKEGCGP